MKRPGYAIVVIVSELLLSLWGGAQAQETSVTFQTGLSLNSINNQLIYYNSTHDTAISTQYSSSWNYFNGITYFWGSTGPDFTHKLGDMVIGDPKEKFRTLIRFDDLNTFIPSTAVVQSVEMTAVFLNWGDPVQFLACFMTRPWSYTEGPASYKSTGWRYSNWNGQASVEWTQPGGWADCSTDVAISFVVPRNEYYGYVTVSFALDATKVAGWLANNGAQNYGLLFRAVNGTLDFITSQWTKDTPALRRPALTITYSTNPAAQPPTPSYPVQLGAVPRVWWVDPSGSDELGGGSASSPFKSPAKALFEAWPGDSIYLRSGVYPGGVDVTRSRITLQSAPGHWAVLSLPLNDPQNAVNVLMLRPGADGGVIQNLEIIGGFYYGIMFATSWENYGTMEERVEQGAGPNNWLIQNVRIHDTGSSAIKLSMKATNNTFANLEIYNTGARLRTNGHGIVAIQVYGIAVRDSYFHDIPGAAVHLNGGTARAVLERNYVARCTFGFNLGFGIEYEYLDPINNPQLHEAIDVTVVNNIIASTSMAGVSAWAARNVTIAHNTIWQAQQDGQSCILVASYLHDYTPAEDVLTSCSGLTVWANILVRSKTARAGPVLQIRQDGLDPSSPFVSAHNVYYDQRGLGPVDFQWGQGAMLEDERTDSTFVGNASGWAQHCLLDLAQPFCDINSLEADPLLDATFAPLGCSPAKGRAAATLPSGVSVVTDDFSGRQRPAGQSFDAGAVQSGAAGAAKPIPPVPTALADKAPYTGYGTLGPVYDKSWPFELWRTHVCKNILVDPVKGNDNQDYNEASNYRKPFKTIAAALENWNQCDRILLKGGVNHKGGFGIYNPNVTIMTDPRDKKRATVLCANTDDEPCIRTGDGNTGGAASLTLSNFDIVMSGNAAGSCIHLNEGAGGGTSTYWDFYLAATGRPRNTLTYIQNMTLTNCGLHGIKLSTFVKGVVMMGLTINSPRHTGIEVRGGGDLKISGNKILSPGDTGIRLGGGARNLLVERNLIKNFTDRGILLGSDETEVEYMDVQWALGRNPPDWHDNINTVVVNNIIDGGAGAGIAFYSARDAVVVHNTILRVAATMQAGVLLNVSPKQTGPTQAVGAPNTNITFMNNIVTLGGGPKVNLMVEARLLQGSMVNSQLTVNLPAGICPARRHHRRMLTDLVGARAAYASGLFRNSVASAASAASGAALGAAARAGGAPRRNLAAASFALAYVNAPGEQGRNPDGSCPIFPSSHAWHMDVTELPVHQNNLGIKRNIGGGNLHPDFAGGYTADNGKDIYYGIPFITVDSRRTPNVQIEIGPDGYPDETDTSAVGFPFPPNAPVEGAYLNCPPSECGGDRHVLLVDNATCLLYETYRSVPPAVTGTGKWQADTIARFNLSRNALGRPLGWTSADAAGLAILPGLVKWDEVVNKGVIDHAIRFTGPNSRQAYSPPATHFAPTGYQGPDAPWMGMRVRLNATYDCSPLARAARIFCTALKTYGGIFADNGSPWFFTGEATPKWDAALQEEIEDIKRIPSSAMEVLDTGCLCINSECTAAECNGVVDVDPNAIPMYPAVTNLADLRFANNVYFKATGVAGRYVDRRLVGVKEAFDGGLAGWKAYTGGDAGSVEKNPALNAANYKPGRGSAAINSVPKLAGVDIDYYGVRRLGVGGKTDAGAVLK